LNRQHFAAASISFSLATIRSTRPLSPCGLESG
jgi:hypothetical protein